MKKSLLSGLVVLFLSMSAFGAENSPYAINASHILKKEGYIDISIIDVKSGGCTISGPFDWYATAYKAEKNGKIEYGFVCAGKIYPSNKN